MTHAHSSWKPSASKPSASKPSSWKPSSWKPSASKPSRPLTSVLVIALMTAAMPCTATAQTGSSPAVSSPPERGGGAGADGARGAEAGTEAVPAASPEAQAADLIDPDHERADHLHMSARPLLDQGRLDEALPLLEEAYRLKHSYDIATNLGATLLALDRPRDAAELLAEALAELPTVIDQAAKTKLLRTYERARARVGIARVTMSATGATVFVDSVAQSEPTPIEHELFLEPGPHRFFARRGAQQTAATVVELHAGVPVAVALGELRNGDQPSADASSTAPDASSPALLYAGITSLALGAVGIGVGIGSYVARGKARSEADDLRATLGGSGACGGATPPPDCASLDERTDAAARYGNLATGALVAGSILTAVGVGLTIGWAASTPDDDTPGSPAALSITFSPGPGSVHISGHF